MIHVPTLLNGVEVCKVFQRHALGISQLGTYIVSSLMLTSVQCISSEPLHVTACGQYCCLQFLSQLVPMLSLFHTDRLRPQ